MSVMKTVRCSEFISGGSGSSVFTSYVALSLVIVLVAQSPPCTGWEVFANEGPLYNIVVTGEGDVIIGGENVILQFENESLSANNLVHTVNPSSVSADGIKSVDIVPTVFQLETLRRETDELHLVFCGSDPNRACYLHSASNITKYWPTMEGGTPVNFASGRHSVMVRTISLRGNYYYLVAVPPDESGDSMEYTFSMRKFAWSPTSTSLILTTK